MKEGAYDFIQKARGLEHLNLLVQRASQQQELLRENLLLREEYTERYGFPASWANTRPCRRHATGAARGRDGFDGAAPRPKRNGQGAIRSRHSPSFPPECATLRRSELRRDPRGLVEMNCFGARARRLYGAGPAKSGRWNWRTAARFFSTKSPNFPMATQPSCCACSKSEVSSASAERNWWRSMVRILAATNKDLRDAVAAKIISRGSLLSASPRCPSRFLPCANAATDVSDALLSISRDVSGANFASQTETLGQRFRGIARLCLARKCPRTAKYDRTRSHPLRFRNHRCQNLQLLRHVLPMDKCRRACSPEFRLGRHAAGCWRPCSQPCRAIQD